MLAIALLPVNKFISCFALLTIIFVSTGCGGAPSSVRSGFTPIRPDPTSTPAAVSTGSAPASLPTSVVSDQVTLSHYNTNRFSIDYPENWQPFERPDGVVFIEPGDRAGYSVVFNDVDQVYSAEELNQYLVTFVAKNFVKDGSGFSAISQETKADGSIVAQFASIDPNLGPAINEVRLWQHDTIVFVLLISATEEQWQISQQKLQSLADTFTPLDTSPIVVASPTPALPVWLLIGPTGNEFGFLYPSDWKILRREERLVAVAMPEADVTFESSVSDWPKATADPTEAAQAAALTYLETLSDDYENIRHQPLTEFPLDTVSGATIDFLYTTKEGTEMAGSVITAASRGKLYRVVFTSPAKYYQGLLQWFNPMYKSFKILSPEEFTSEDQ